MLASVPRQSARGYVVAGVEVLVVAIAYYLVAVLGLHLALVRGQVTPLWPPTGVALAGLLLRGIRCWPGITVGALLANVAMGPSVLGVVAIAAGNTLAPVCACLLLDRLGFRVELRRLKDVLALVFVAALAGMLISATIGAGTLVLAGVLPADAFWATWSVWWTGDAMGVLVVAPVLLVGVSWRWAVRMSAWRWVEAAALVLGITALTLVVTRYSVSLLFLNFPLLVWAALRFRQAGAASCNLIVSALVVLAAVGRQGPFASLDLLSTMITLQAFNGSATLTALVLAAIATERDEAQRAVRVTVSQLAEAVRGLEPHRLLYNSLSQRVLSEHDRSAPTSRENL